MTHANEASGVTEDTAGDAGYVRKIGVADSTPAGR